MIRQANDSLPHLSLVVHTVWLLLPGLLTAGSRALALESEIDAAEQVAVLRVTTSRTPSRGTPSSYASEEPLALLTFLRLQEALLRVTTSRSACRTAEIHLRRSHVASLL